MLPPARTSSAGCALSNVTGPGPRYLDQVSRTGGGGFRKGAFVPLVYFASSLAQTVSARGLLTVAVFARVLAIDAVGPSSAGPFSSNLIAGGLLPTALSTKGLMM